MTPTPNKTNEENRTPTKWTIIVSPGSCWATGPLTGDDYEDLVVCPGCRAIKVIDEALQLVTTDSAMNKPRDNRRGMTIEEFAKTGETPKPASVVEALRAADEEDPSQKIAEAERRALNAGMRWFLCRRAIQECITSGGECDPRENNYCEKHRKEETDSHNELMDANLLLSLTSQHQGENPTNTGANNV